MALCPHCGSEISDNAKFCPKCGQSVAPQQEQGQPAADQQSQAQPAADQQPQAQPAADQQFQGQPAGDQQFQGQPGGAPFQGQPDGGAYQGQPGGAPYQGQPGPAPYMVPSISSTVILGRAIGVVMRKPIKLWGLSLLVVFLSSLATVLGGAIPIIGIGVGLVLQFGMAWVYLEGYRGREVKVDQIFEGFYKFWPTLAGMGWREILMILWFIVPFGIGLGGAGALGSAVLGNVFSKLFEGLISGYGLDFDNSILYSYGAILGFAALLVVVGLIVGTVLYCIKYYSYLLVPYVLRDNIDRKPTEVAREADAMTRGFKGRIFLTDFLIVLLVLGINIVFGILGVIPYLGGFFNFISTIVNIIIGLFTPLLFGLTHAAWYDEIVRFRGNPMV